MPLYENKDNAKNRINIKKEYRGAVITCPEKTLKFIIAEIKQHARKTQKPVAIAFEGWYGIDWKAIIQGLEKSAGKENLKIAFKNINTVFKPIDEIDKYKTKYITDDPAFGYVNSDGTIKDITELKKISELKDVLKKLKSGKNINSSATIVYGPGSAIKELIDISATSPNACLWGTRAGQAILRKSGDVVKCIHGDTEDKSCTIRSMVSYRLGD